MIPELKVPYLHEKQVERAANELLHKYAKEKGKPVRAPIDVENILEGYFKLDLVYIDLPDFSRQVRERYHLAEALVVPA